MDINECMLYAGSCYILANKYILGIAINPLTSIAIFAIFTPDGFIDERKKMVPHRCLLHQRHCTSYFHASHNVHSLFVTRSGPSLFSDDCFAFIHFVPSLCFVLSLVPCSFFTFVLFLFCFSSRPFRRLFCYTPYCHPPYFSTIHTELNRNTYENSLQSYTSSIYLS